MWDWKQVKWMKLLGWNVFDESQGKYRMLSRLQASITFWMIPISVFGEAVAIMLSVSRGDYKDAITSISILGTSIPMIFKAFKWAYRGSEIKEIILSFEELDQCRKRYFSRDLRSDSIMKTHTQVCYKYCYLFFGSLLAGSHWPVRPLILAMYGEYTTVVNDWVPWNNKTFSGWIYHYIWISTALLISVSGMLAYETLMLSFNEMTIGLFESISYGLSTLEFKGNVRRQLYELHKMHREALNLTKKLTNFSSFIIQADGLLLTFTMCCGVLEITRDWTSTTKKINTVEMCLVYSLFFYLQCYKCQMVKIVCSDVAVTSFDNDWYLGTPDNKRNLSIIAQMARRPVRFGRVIPADLSTFAAVMKTSFSYYNALKAFDIH